MSTKGKGDKSKSRDGSASTVTFRHNISRTTLVDGVKTVENETLLDGKAKGISFYYLFKNNSDFLKIKGSHTGGVWTIDYTKGDKNEKHEFDDKALREFLKKEKKLEFVLKYLAGQKKLARTSSKKQKGGESLFSEANLNMRLSDVVPELTEPTQKRSGSKKGSKGGSKKAGSKKGSKKAGSKKGSKKAGSKKGSKKGNKRTAAPSNRLRDVLA